MQLKLETVDGTVALEDVRSAITLGHSGIECYNRTKKVRQLH